MKQTLFALALCGLATGALAHSPLQATTPADGAQMTTMPDQITFTFKRNIRLTRVTWTHADATSDQLDLSGQTRFATEFAFPFGATVPGSYLIEWRGLGDDGHPQTGSFTFDVE